MYSLEASLSCLTSPASSSELTNSIVNQNLDDALPLLPIEFVDLMVIDPPYNLTKNYTGNIFKSCDSTDHVSWFEKTLSSLLPLLRPNASLYVCSDWHTSNLVFPALDNHVQVRNRITWER